MFEEEWVHAFVFLCFLGNSWYNPEALHPRLWKFCWAVNISIQRQLSPDQSAQSFEHMAVSDGSADYTRESFVRSLFEGAATTQMSDILLELIITCQVWGLIHSKPRTKNSSQSCKVFDDLGPAPLHRPSNPDAACTLLVMVGFELLSLNFTF